jgi:hypothetical protein
MGVFKKDGRIYVVKPNRDKTRVYAKEIVESPARMTENGEVVDFEAVYAPGVVFKLTEADRLNLEDAKDWLTKFARCIVCGRNLKAAKSVAAAIGPVCAKYFAGSKHCNHNQSASPAGALVKVAPGVMLTPEQAAASTPHATSVTPSGELVIDINTIVQSPKSIGEIADAMDRRDAALKENGFCVIWDGTDNTRIAIK